MLCNECGDEYPGFEMCPRCHCCLDCCECDYDLGDDFDADELGLDPEEDELRGGQ